MVDKSERALKRPAGYIEGLREGAQGGGESSRDGRAGGAPRPVVCEVHAKRWLFSRGIVGGSGMVRFGR